VQWELSDQERTEELEQQATASLLWAVDVPQTILRMLLSETGIERAYSPPEGYDPEEQGYWGIESGHLSIQTSHPIGTGRVRRRLSLH